MLTQGPTSSGWRSLAMFPGDPAVVSGDYDIGAFKARIGESYVGGGRSPRGNGRGEDGGCRYPDEQGGVVDHLLHCLADVFATPRPVARRRQARRPVPLLSRDAHLREQPGVFERLVFHEIGRASCRERV